MGNPCCSIVCYSQGDRDRGYTAHSMCIAFVACAWDFYIQEVILPSDDNCVIMKTCACVDSVLIIYCTREIRIW